MNQIENSNSNSNHLHPLPPIPESLTFQPYTEGQIAAARTAPSELDQYENHGRPLDALPPATPKEARLYHFEQAAYTLHTQPLNVQIRYADARVRAKCADESFHAKVLFPRFANQEWRLKDVLLVHLTFMGGLAYCACFAPTQELRRNYAQILREFVAWRMRQPNMQVWVEQNTHFYPDGTTIDGNTFGYIALGGATLLMALSVFFFFFCSGHWLWVGFVCILGGLFLLSPMNRVMARWYVDYTAQQLLSIQTHQAKKE